MHCPRQNAAVSCKNYRRSFKCHGAKPERRKSDFRPKLTCSSRKLCIDILFLIINLISNACLKLQHVCVSTGARTCHTFVLAAIFLALYIPTYINVLYARVLPYSVILVVDQYFIEREILFRRKFSNRPCCGAARQAQTLACTCTSHVIRSKKLVACAAASLARAPNRRRLE